MANKKMIAILIAVGIVVGTGITLLTRFFQNQMNLVGSNLFGYPYPWFSQGFGPHDYNLLKIDWTIFLFDTVFWSAIVLVLLFIILRKLYK